MLRLRVAATCSVMALLLAAGCADTSEDAPEEDAITAGQLVAGTSPWYWANVPLEQHLQSRTLMGLQRGNPSDYTSAEDPLALRLQLWADRFDKVMRAKVKGAQAPSPVALVLRSSKRFNADSAPTTARIGVGYGPAGQKAEPDTALSLSRSGEGADAAARTGARAEFFAKAPGWGDAASLLPLWNAAITPYSGCSLKQVGALLQGTGSGCPNATVRTEDTLLEATSPFVTFSTDYLAAVADERGLMFTMAHELGHVYRAHTSPLVLRNYGFWYDQGPEVARRPVPASDKAALSRLYSELRMDHRALDDIQGSSLASRARRLPAFIVAEFEKTRASSPRPAGTGLDACPGYTAWRTGVNVPEFLEDAQDPGLPSATLAKAQIQLEKALLQCPARVAFNISANASTPDLINGEFLDRYRSQLPSEFGQVKMPHPGQSVQSYLQQTQALAAALDVKEGDFRAKMLSNRIGLYTTEQEADEIAVALMSAAGISKDDILAGATAAMRALESKRKSSGAPPPTLGSGDADADTCSAWMTKGFVGADGAPIVMTLGALNDTHHGNCYRLYNMWREAKAQRYATGPKQANPSPAWSTLRSRADELSLQARFQGL